MKIAKREDFTLIFMNALAQYYPDRYVSLSSVAKDFHLSPLFLKHIAASLLGKGLIISKEGAGGGYMLSRDPKDIFISEIIGSISTGVITPVCVHGGICPVLKDSCSCKSLWDRVNQYLFSYLKKISLSEFAKL